MGNHRLQSGIRDMLAEGACFFPGGNCVFICVCELCVLTAKMQNPQAVQTILFHYFCTYV
jgi:hypothetical protein